MSLLLSKSKYLLGLQCPKLLWLSTHEIMPEPSKALQHRFDQGHEVGELAKKLYPQGIDIETEDFSKNLEQSKELLKKGIPLFEPAFKVNDLYSRADILNPIEEKWDIIEVKSSTEVKDVNINDVSFQRYVYEHAGLKIRKCFILVINNEYVKEGEIDPKKLFKLVDITKEVEEVSEGIKDRIDDMLKILTAKKCPEIAIGNKCSDPYECLLTDRCWKDMPENNVFNLYRGNRLAEELYKKGIIKIQDIPDDVKLNDKQEIQKENRINIHKEAIKHFLQTFKEPLYFLDFETFNTPIPLYTGTKPYQQIPFQFSLHIQENNKITHEYFLATGKVDPRAEFLKALKAVIGDKGSIVTYNQAFEMNILKQLQKAYPKEKWITNVLDRIVDLLSPFRNFHYYNPKQQGSASIKAVLPALLGKGYEDLNIQHGDDASLAFLDITFEKVPEAEKKKLRNSLEKYCKRDTEAMVWIVEKLREMVNK
jgi:CRISPR/Cas system-associated exonuclease Cas4 (RecB family)